MRKRHFWLDALDAAWRRRPVVWLSGVRRSYRRSIAGVDTEFLDLDGLIARLGG